MTLRSLKYRLEGWLSTSWTARWRRAVARFWYGRDKGHVFFLGTLAAVVVMVGSFGFAAYSSHVRTEFLQQRRADLTCLARNIYFEARSESDAGQRAVAEVTMNRVASPRFPDTVCDVVHEQRWDARRKRYVGAFSWTEFDWMPLPEGEAWHRAVAAAHAVYDGHAKPSVEAALFYHSDSIEPRWSKTQARVTKIGRHIFYE